MLKSLQLQSIKETWHESDGCQVGAFWVDSDGFVNYVYYCSMAIMYNVFLKSWLFVGTCFIMCHLDGC